VSALGNVHSLDLNDCLVSDVSALSNVHTFNLSCCYKVSDVSALGKVHTLDLGSCNVSDVNALGNVHILDIIDCLGISDVSALDKEPLLDIRLCDNVDDIWSPGCMTPVDEDIESNVYSDFTPSNNVNVWRSNVHTLNLPAVNVIGISEYISEYFDETGTVLGDRHIRVCNVRHLVDDDRDNEWDEWEDDDDDDT
jgi:hypothetical protein